MAIITAFEHAALKRPRLQPTQVRCYWSVFRGDRGPILQLDTYGSAQREMPGKQSQTLQLTPQAAAELVTILKREFALI